MLWSTALVWPIVGPAAATPGFNAVAVNFSVLDRLGPPPPPPHLLPALPVIMPAPPPGANAFMAPNSVTTTGLVTLPPPAVAPRSQLFVAPDRGSEQPARAAPTSRPQRPAPTPAAATSSFPGSSAAIPPAPRIAPPGPAPVPAPARVPSSAVVAALPSPAPAAIPPAPVSSAPPVAVTAAPTPPAPTAPRPVPAAPIAPPVLSAPSFPAPSPATASRPPAAAPPASAPPPRPTQTAALPGGLPSGVLARLPFRPGSTELPGDAAASLNPVVARLKADPQLRVTLTAFSPVEAGGDSSKARRQSLSRALAARAFLIEQGIPSTRVEVSAQLAGANDSMADRLDAAVLAP